MTETYVNVASSAYVTIGAYLVAISALILIGASAFLLVKKRQRPIAMIVFACLLMAVQILPYPKAIWMGREVIWISIASLVLLSWQATAGRPVKTRLLSISQIGVGTFSMLFHTAAGAGDPREIQLNSTALACTRHWNKKTYPLASCWLEFSDGKAVISPPEGRDIDIDNDDLYQDSIGRYLSGKQVAIQVDDWIKGHRARTASVN